MLAMSNRPKLRSPCRYNFSIKPTAYVYTSCEVKPFQSEKMDHVCMLHHFTILHFLYAVYNNCTFVIRKRLAEGYSRASPVYPGIGITITKPYLS